MSEQRHQQQQRRQRRKAAARPRTSGGGSNRDRARVAGAADRELAQLLTGMAAIVVRDAHEPADALDAEQWASRLIGTWHARPLPGADVEAMFFPGFVDALEAIGTAAALATLRAFAAVGAPAHARRARTAANRLAAKGLPETSWSGALGTARPVAAALMSEPAFDDGLSVMVEFAGADVEPHTLGVYIDHNMGGLVKDVFLAGPLSEVRSRLAGTAPNGSALTIGDLDLAEARARVEAALFMLDHTLDPPVNEDVRPMRALIDARMSLLPGGFDLADDFQEITPEARTGLLEDFLAAPEGRRWRGDEHAEDIAELAIDFGADYNHGGPLRWSPVVVEVFMTSWLARKVTRETDFFTRVPVVLRTWVKYAGRRRDLPAALVREAVAAVASHHHEMLAAVGDPGAWGPAKSFAVAALAAGVDLADPEAVEGFVERYNGGLAA